MTSHAAGRRPTADFESFTQRCQSACSASMLPIIRPARTSACRTDRYSCSRSIVLVVIGCITLVAAGGWFTEQRLAFSFTSLLVNLTPGNGAQHGFRTKCARSNNSSHTSLSAGCFIQHSTVERTCLPPLQTSCFTRVSLLKVVRHGTSGHLRRRYLEKTGFSAESRRGTVGGSPEPYHCRREEHKVRLVGLG